MKHLGDITKLDGAKLPPVDIITGGSPCQDLSVAGKREGLSGARSGLFMEQIRIIKEMRRATNGEKPRFMVWENVPGAFSSNKGEDFRCVLEETVRIVEPDAVVPGPPKGKWAHAGCVVGDGWSVAWRVHDAQFWGVPQRRKRISLVADFGGECAPEVLFERKSLSGDPSPRGEEGQEAPGDAGTGASEAGGVAVLNDQGGGMMHVTEDVTGTLRAQEHGHQPLVFEPGVASRCGGHVYEGVAGTVRANAGDNQQAVVYGISSYDSNAMKSPNPHSGIYEADTARTLDNQGGNPACNQGGMAVVCDTTEIVCLEGNGSRPSHQGDGWHEGDPMYTLNATEHHAVCCAGFSGGQSDKAGSIGYAEDVCPTLRGGEGGNQKPCVVYDARGNGDGHTAPTITGDHGNRVTDYTALCVGNGQANQSIGNVVNTISSRNYKGGQCVMTYQDCTGTLDCGISKGTGNQLANNDMFVSNGHIVRRLTPLECTRLQGFPEHWVDIGDWVDSKGKTHKDADSPKYKALGNSIALPFWEWLAGRMVKSLGVENPTMGSLFDGISGFCLVFARVGCKPVWASEIDEFCIAVTKERFL